MSRHEDMIRSDDHSSTHLSRSISESDYALENLSIYKWCTSTSCQENQKSEREEEFHNYPHYREYAYICKVEK